MVSYKGLQVMLLERKISKKELMYKVDISSTTVDKLLKNQPVNLAILEKLCGFLSCQIGDIVEYIPDQRLNECQEVL